ncbi:MAG: lysyl oxidase family protein [Methanobacteriota archaeon]
MDHAKSGLYASLSIAAVLLSAPWLPVGIPTADASHAATVPCSDPRGCPDLLVDAETMEPSVHTMEFKAQHCVVQEGMVEPGTRRVVRFTYTTPNLGSGDLIIGSPGDHPEWFEAASCHGHYHFREYADYRLWTTSAFAKWDALRSSQPAKLPGEILAEDPKLTFVFGAKLGFCVIDIALYDPTGGPPKYEVCGSQGVAGSPPIPGFQGISTGWADEYDSDLDGQFVDVTGLASGTYVLEEEVNPERLFLEEDYANNRAWVSVTI